MDTLVVNDLDYGRRIAERAGVQFNAEADVSIVRVLDDDLMGGVIFNNFTGESIGIHSAAFRPRWISRNLLWMTFHYPFEQLGVNRIFGVVPADNADAFRFNDNLGFKTVATIDGVYKNGVGAVVMCMERNECRFLKLKPRQQLN
jgi:RimJ/RimL family protein N-acetyltransferase